MSQIPSIYQATVSSLNGEQQLAPLFPVGDRDTKLKILYVINQEYPVRAVITVMTLEEPYEGHYVGQLKKVVHRYSTEYIPIDQFKGITPVAEGTEQDLSEHKIENGALQLYFQV
jgi:hypothetical protein